MDIDYGILQKYRGGTAQSLQEYYNEHLAEKINAAVRNITIYRRIAQKLEANEGIDKALIEKITDSLQGNDNYSELSTKDIDELVAAFGELQRGLNG